MSYGGTFPVDKNSTPLPSPEDESQITTHRNFGVRKKSPENWYLKDVQSGKKIQSNDRNADLIKSTNSASKIKFYEDCTNIIVKQPYSISISNSANVFVVEAKQNNLNSSKNVLSETLLQIPNPEFFKNKKASFTNSKPHLPEAENCNVKTINSQITYFDKSFKKLEESEATRNQKDKSNFQINRNSNESSIIEVSTENSSRVNNFQDANSQTETLVESTNSVFQYIEEENLKNHQSTNFFVNWMVPHNLGIS